MFTYWLGEKGLRNGMLHRGLLGIHQTSDVQRLAMYESTWADGIIFSSTFACSFAKFQSLRVSVELFWKVAWVFPASILTFPTDG